MLLISLAYMPMKSGPNEQIYQLGVARRKFPSGTRINLFGGARHLLREGKPLSETPKPINAVVYGCDDERKIEKFDLLESDPPIVSDRLKQRLLDLCPEDVQVFPIGVALKDCTPVSDYWVVNVLNIVRALDRERSMFMVMNPEVQHAQKLQGDRGDKDASLRTAVYIPGGLDGHHIAREATYPQILVSETLKSIIGKEFVGIDCYHKGDSRED